MAKRKRGADSLSIRHLEKLQEDISRALKEAKGFERQRMSKRQRAFDKDPEKKAALERDISVLKSLDLHQTARAHLYSSLLRIKSIANHEDLPAQLKKGVAKPELAEDERLVLHNVTSGLYNRDGVKKAVDKAITFVCEALGIPVPQKGAKGKRERKEKTENAQGAEPVPLVRGGQNTTPVDNEDETDFEGFSADDDDDEDADPAVQDLDSDAEIAQENDISVLDGLLGSSSDEDEDEDDEERTRLWEKYRGKETVNLDDISLSGGDSEPNDAVDSDDDDEPRTKPPNGDKKVTSRGVFLSSSPEPQRKRSKKATSATAAGRPTDSMFLPSLMGGYVSGSESASDVDVAPPKKRRGQQARRAIWAQKYGSRAKHLQDAAKNKGGRDDGWDMKRGAVDAGDSRTPWKKGVKNPFSSGGGGGGGQQQETRRPPPPPKKRDDQGPLHPSWEARKKAKESQKAASFAGSKVVFD
ncbi:hypothetical protein G3M48_006940 [Beauveria asiatica]|uniref:Bud22 domain-containing protein n=1 Tax=Beauveria asiatica TaxID=1069075 RepID=A0AAW0RNX6_9HYPO